MYKDCIYCKNAAFKISKKFHCWFECGLDSYVPCQIAGTEDYYEPRKGISKIWNNILIRLLGFI